MSIPKTSLIFVYVTSTILSSLFVLLYTAIPPSISASAYFWSKWQHLFTAIKVLFGSNPFSNLLLASLLKIFFEVSLTFTGLNIADSITIFLVSFSTSVESPPITPARPIALLESAITISFSDNSLSCSSSVVSFSPFFAILTVNVFPSLSAS